MTAYRSEGDQFVLSEVECFKSFVATDQSNSNTWSGLSKLPFNELPRVFNGSQVESSINNLAVWALFVPLTWVWLSKARVLYTTENTASIMAPNLHWRIYTSVYVWCHYKNCILGINIITPVTDLTKPGCNLFHLSSDRRYKNSELLKDYSICHFRNQHHYFTQLNNHLQKNVNILHSLKSQIATIFNDSSEFHKS